MGAKELITFKAVSNDHSDIFDRYEADLALLTSISNFVSNRNEVIHHFLVGSATPSFMAKSIFDLDPAVSSLDASYWSEMLNKTDVLECMTADMRNEWSRLIHERKTPSFTKENVIPTIQSLLLSRGDMLAEKIAGLFNSLSGNHVTNSAVKFGERMIVENILDSHGYVNYRKAEYLHDLRSIIAKLSNRDPESASNTRSDISNIVKTNEFGQWMDFDGGDFRIKLFKKGTAHMEVSSDVCLKLNEILATKYPHAVSATSRSSKKAYKERETKKTLLSPTTVKSLSEVCQSLRSSDKSVSVYRHKLTDEACEVLEFVGGKSALDTWYFDYEPLSVLSAIVRSQMLPDKKSHQFYPTKEKLAVMACDLLGVNRERSNWATLLEPSAGQGGLLSAVSTIKKDKVTCVELDSVQCEILKAKGFANTLCQDFLSWNSQETFDYVLMNPPFSDGRAMDHLEKAYSHLNEQGQLVAILPSSLSNKVQEKFSAADVSESIQGEFDDTNVSVILVKLSK